MDKSVEMFIKDVFLSYLETNCMAKTLKRRLGDIGEGVAAKYLEKKGFLIVDRNYLKPWGEIDLIAKKANCLYFIEVKSVSRESSRWPKLGVTRESDTYRPEENVHPAKLRRLHRAIQTYLLDHKVSESMSWEIVVACVYLDFDTHKAHVDLIENVIM